MEIGWVLCIASDRIIVMAAQPDSIKAVIDIPLSHPRDCSGLDFVTMEGSIKQLVREGVQKLGIT